MHPVAVLMVLHAASTGLQAEGSVGIAVSNEFLPSAALARFGAGLRGSYLGASVFFEKSFAHGGLPNESCREAGAGVGGCLYEPMAVGSAVFVTPVRWLHVEPFVQLTGAWVRREVFLHASPRDDLALGGGIGVNFLWLPVVVGLQTRYLQYVTYHPPGFSNTGALMIALDVAYRFSVS